MRFSFKYDGNYISSDELSQINNIPGLKEYKFKNLVFSLQNEQLDYGAEYSLLKIKNVGNSNSGILTDICSIDEQYDIDATGEELRPGYFEYDKSVTRIYRVVGSGGGYDEYKMLSERPSNSKRPLYYTCSGGRSSQGLAPFFEANNGYDKGFLLAVGWTGQWFASFTRNSESINVRAGIEDLSFYLEPNEEIRTSSILILPYSKGRDNAHNCFRKIIKERFSLIHKRNNGVCPLSFQFWGGSTDDLMIKEISNAKENDYGFEYCWIDAAWYGDYKKLCKNEFCDGWFETTGDWSVNPMVHPGGLKNIFSLAENANMKALLWFEPERAFNTNKFVLKHKEMFITADGYDCSLLNLSRKDAKDYMYNTISYYVKTLNLKCYRQDFNFDPLPIWQSYDKENRKGITQIKHISGLYEVWDRLLQTFPDLIIDNCASGGRRIDIETLQRSVPLWRSDAQCVFDYDANLSQIQNTALSYWLPYSGCGVSAFVNDVYKFRSCYAAALSTNFRGYEEFYNIPLDVELLKNELDEYKNIRSFFDKDFYPVLGFPTDNYSFGGWEFFDADVNEGILQVFRRNNCESESVKIKVQGISSDKEYYFFGGDFDGKIFTGKELISGIDIYIKNKRESVLMRFKEANNE